MIKGEFCGILPAFTGKKHSLFFLDISGKTEKRWRHYFGVPDNVWLPKKVDCEAVRKAEECYCEGFDLVDGEFKEWHIQSFSLFIKKSERYHAFEKCELKSKGCEELYSRARTRIYYEKIRNKFEKVVREVGQRIN